MTLIAAAGIDTYPVVFGDLLISGPERPGSAPDISLAGAVTSVFPPGSDWAILRLSQKVVLLGDNCVIAWAGDVVFARTVTAGLRALASRATLSLPIVETYLAGLDPTMKDKVSFVGWVRDGDVFHQFWYRADTAEGALFGRVSAGGSAATDFVMLASQISGGSWNALGRALAGLELAISSMLSATSLLLQSELSRENNLLQYFGGGYEIATFIGGRFAKVGDIAFVFWMANVTDGEVALSGPWLVLKQDYADDLLLLHVLRMRPGNVSTDPPLIEEDRHVVAPFGSTVDAARANSIFWPGMEAKFTCHVVLVHSPNDITVFNRIDYSESKTPKSISFSLEDRHISFEVNRQFADELTQSVRAGFAEL